MEGCAWSNSTSRINIDLDFADWVLLSAMWQNYDCGSIWEDYLMGWNILELYDVSVGYNLYGPRGSARKAPSIEYFWKNSWPESKTTTTPVLLSWQCYGGHLKLMKVSFNLFNNWEITKVFKTPNNTTTLKYFALFLPLVLKL